MQEHERRKVSLAGLGLISAGAVLGLALAGQGQTRDDTPTPPAATAPADPPRPPS